MGLTYLDNCDCCPDSPCIFCEQSGQVPRRFDFTVAGLAGQWAGLNGAWQVFGPDVAGPSAACCYYSQGNAQTIFSYPRAALCLNPFNLVQGLVNNQPTLTLWPDANSRLIYTGTPPLCPGGYNPRGFCDPAGMTFKLQGQPDILATPGSGCPKRVLTSSCCWCGSGHSWPSKLTITVLEACANGKLANQNNFPRTCTCVREDGSGQQSNAAFCGTVNGLTIPCSLTTGCADPYQPNIGLAGGPPVWYSDSAFNFYGKQAYACIFETYQVINSCQGLYVVTKILALDGSMSWSRFYDFDAGCRNIQCAPVLFPANPRVDCQSYNCYKLVQSPGALPPGDPLRNSCALLFMVTE